MHPKGIQPNFNWNTQNLVPYQVYVAEQFYIRSQDFLVCACFKNQNSSHVSILVQIFKGLSKS